MNSLFFDSFFYPQSRPQYVVISDSEYKKYQQEQAEQELLVLESKKNRYEAAVTELDSKIKEIQTAHNLLPASKEEATADT